MIIRTYRERIKAEVKEKYLKINNNRISDIELRFLFCNLWLLAIDNNNKTLLLSPYVEEELIPIEATDKEVELITSNYLEKIKELYSSEIELMREQIKTDKDLLCV